MQASTLPPTAWLKIAILFGLLIMTFMLSRYFWKTGAHTLASAPLLLYAATLTLFSSISRMKR